MGKAQHILICFHDFNRGGTERIALNMARRWCDLGRQVTLLCGARRGGMEESVDPRIKVLELDPPLPRSATSRLRLGRRFAPYVERLAPDVIFLPGNFHFVLVPALGKVARRIGAVLLAKISNPAVPAGWAAPVVRALFRHYRGRIDGLAAMNSGLEREIRTIVPDAPVVTLYDPVYLRTQEGAAGPQAADEDGLALIVWAGRFEPQKDVALALRTLVALNQMGRAKLVMLGDGPQFGAMRALASRLGLGGDQLELVGHVPAIDPYLARARALFVSSRFEGGPAVAVEALAHGVPVVSTDCSHFLRDIMTIPEAGRIVPSRDPVVLARALHEVCALPRPARELLAPLVAPLAAQRCADAYLDWFDARKAEANP